MVFDVKLLENPGLSRTEKKVALLSENRIWEKSFETDPIFLYFKTKIVMHFELVETSYDLKQ